MQKLDDDITRLNVVAPTALKEKIEKWRRRQPELPTMSEAMRLLLEVGLEHAPRRPVRQ